MTAAVDQEVEPEPPGWLDSFFPRRDAPYLAAVAVVLVAATVTLLVASGDQVALQPALLGLAGFCTLISAGDAVTRHIPNRANAAAFASAFPLLLLANATHHGSLVRALLGALAGFGAYLALWLVAPSSLGLGDVKLAPYLGAYLGYFGWACWTQGLIFGFLAQGIIVGAGLLTRRLHAKSRVAHGPAMCIGACLAVVLALPHP